MDIISFTKEPVTTYGSLLKVIVKGEGVGADSFNGLRASRDAKAFGYSNITNAASLRKAGIHVSFTVSFEASIGLILILKDFIKNLTIQNLDKDFRMNDFFMPDSVKKNNDLLTKFEASALSAFNAHGIAIDNKIEKELASSILPISTKFKAIATINLLELYNIFLEIVNDGSLNLCGDKEIEEFAGKLCECIETIDEDLVASMLTKICMKGAQNDTNDITG